MSGEKGNPRAYCFTAKGEPCRTGQKLGRDCGRHPKTNKPGTGGVPAYKPQDYQDEIVKALHAGAYVETAVAHAGLSKGLYYQWAKRAARALRKAEDDGTPIPAEDLPFVEFMDAVEKAMSASELDALSTIRRAAKGQDGGPPQWTAAAWLLERRHPSRYGRKDRMQLEGSKDNPVVVESYEPPEDAGGGS